MVGPYMERYRSEIMPVAEEYQRLIVAHCTRLQVDPVDIPHQETDLNNLFHTFAWLFRPTFADVPVETFQRIALVGRYYLTEALMMDRLCDGQCHWPTAYCLFPSIIQECTHTILAQLFPPDSPFWTLFSEQQWNYRRCIVLEKQHHGRLVPYSQDEFEAIATGVMAKAKLVTGALAYLSGQVDLLGPAFRSQDQFALADRILDDIADWREDLRAGNFTSLLTDAALGLGVTDPEELDEERVGLALYLDGHVERYLQMALAATESALDDAILLRSKAWCEVLLAVREQARSQLASLRRVLRKLGIEQVRHRG